MMDADRVKMGRMRHSVARIHDLIWNEELETEARNRYHVQQPLTWHREQG